jgi:hypothetical protein
MRLAILPAGRLLIARREGKAASECHNTVSGLIFSILRI